MPVPSSRVNCNSFLDFLTASHAFTFTALKSDLLKVSKSTISSNNGSTFTLEKSIFSTVFVSCAALFASFFAAPCDFIVGKWKKSQDELKGFLGDEYQDFDLVVALPNGRPCEDRIILKEFAKLREDAGLPKVVFHSLRHSSTTYKLKLNHGDLKATQGDTGHAEIDMITSIYAHILDEDRKVNAQKFETAFYAKPDLRNVRPPEEPAKSEPATLDLESLVEQLQKSPELASALAALIAAQAPAK